MESHKGQRLSDDLASGLAVIKDIEGMRGGGVIHDGDGQIARQGFGDEKVNRFVQLRGVMSGSRDKGSGRYCS